MEMNERRQGQAHRGRHSYWYWHPVRALKWGGCHSMVVFVTRVGVGGGGDENGVACALPQHVKIVKFLVRV